MKVCVGKGNTVPGDEEIRPLEVRSPGVEELQLDRPLPEFRLRPCGRLPVVRGISSREAPCGGPRTCPCNALGLVVGYGDSVRGQVLDRLPVEPHLPVAEKVLQVCPDDRFSLGHDLFCHHGLFIVRLGLPLDDADRPLRAGPDTGAKPVAEEVTHEPCLPVDDLKRSFRAVGDAETAPGAFLLVDIDDLSLHREISYTQSSVMLSRYPLKYLCDMAVSAPCRRIFKSFCRVRWNANNHAQ